MSEPTLVAMFDAYISAERLEAKISDEAPHFRAKEQEERLRLANAARIAALAPLRAALAAADARAGEPRWPWLGLAGYTDTVISCARCGQDHPITFWPLDRPMDEWREWGICSNTWQPVMLRRQVATLPADVAATDEGEVTP